MKNNFFIKKPKRHLIAFLILFCGLFANTAVGQKNISRSVTPVDTNFATAGNWTYTTFSPVATWPLGSGGTTLITLRNGVTTANIAVNDAVTGTSIPASSTVSVINSTTTFTINKAATTASVAAGNTIQIGATSLRNCSIATSNFDAADFITLNNDLDYTIDNTFYLRRLSTLAAAATTDMKITSIGANAATNNIVIDVFADQFYTSGGYAVIHQSTSGTKFTIDCKIKLNNTFTGTFSNRNNVLRCLGNANNILEFGPNSVIENTATNVGGPIVSFPQSGTVLMNGEIKGFPAFICGGGGASGTAIGNTIFGPTSNNPSFNLVSNNINILSYANVTVNTAANNTFFKNTAGGKLQFNNMGVGLFGTVTINNANVWNSILRSSTASSDGVTGANLIINADQTTNIGAVEMAQGVISTVNTGSPVINLTVAAGKRVNFGASNLNTWVAGGASPLGSGARFNIYGFDNATIKFGTSSTGLTSTQLGMIVIKDGASVGAAVKLDSRGNLVLTTSTTWIGATSTDWTDSSNWDNGVPDATKDVTIETGTYQPEINSDVSIKSLKLNTSTSLKVSSGFNLTVTGAVVNGGTMTIENNANLIQQGTTNTNTGNVIVKRNSNDLFRLDYTIWSSPVAGQNLLAFSPATFETRFYNYKEDSNKYSVVTSPSTTPFAAATGYLIRMPNTDLTSGYDAGTTSIVYPGVFTGVPNNGDITKAVTYNGSAPFGYNAIGNPYPSTIDAQAFIAANTANIESSLYFWRKINAAAGSAYAVYNPMGSTAATPSSALPNGTIQVGQGFFVKAKSTSNVTFTNAMRVANNDNQIFRTKQVAKDRVWLNLTNTSGVFIQALVGYTADAISGIDMYDAKYINDSPIALTSNIYNEEYTIQGRPTFDPSDLVALNFKTDAAGDYSIALDHFDGVFATGQDVYLVDSKTGTETDLKVGAYTFNAVAGIDNARFSLKYQKTLKVGAPAFNENSVSVYKNNGAFYVNSGSIAISNIKVFDVQGRLLSEQKNVKATTAVIPNLRAGNQVLIVKISGEDNNVVTKKVVN